MKIFLRAVCACVCVFLIVIIAFQPEIYLKSAFAGIKLWATVVLPSLLPFFFLTTLASSLGITSAIAKLLGKPFSILFRQSGVCSYAFLMSVLSGYPIGAKIIADLKENGLITADEATRAGALCSTSGPLFIVGSVGVGMFADKRAGALILVSHILAACVCGLIFRFYGKSKPSAAKSLAVKPKVDNILYDCAYSAVISVAVVGGFICVFFVLSDVFYNFRLLLPIELLLKPLIGGQLAQGVALGTIECTRGCLTLSAAGINRLSLSLSCALVSFGGLSVVIQSLAFLGKAKANAGIFVLSKILQSVVGFIICFLLFPVFNFQPAAGVI